MKGSEVMTNDDYIGRGYLLSMMETTEVFVAVYQIVIRFKSNVDFFTI